MTLFLLIADDEEERNLRRVSYLKATKEDRMHIDSDAENDNALPHTPKNSTASDSASENTPRHAPSIQRIRALFGEKGLENAQCQPESLREGFLHCKVTAIDGKVSGFSFILFFYQHKYFISKLLWL